MKTAEEWMREEAIDGCAPVLHPSIIRAIQDDAYRAGMTEAAEELNRRWGPDVGPEILMAHILNARDRKTGEGT